MYNTCPRTPSEGVALHLSPYVLYRARTIIHVLRRLGSHSNTTRVARADPSVVERIVTLQRCTHGGPAPGGVSNTECYVNVVAVEVAIVELGQNKLPMCQNQLSMINKSVRKSASVTTTPATTTCMRY